jgi:hypothetical protein
MDERARRLGILDTKLAQGAALFFGVVVAKLVPAILEVCVWWFVAAAILFAIKPAFTFFGKERGAGRHP